MQGVAVLRVVEFGGGEMKPEEVVAMRVAVREMVSRFETTEALLDAFLQVGGVGGWGELRLGTRKTKKGVVVWGFLVVLDAYKS